MHIVVRFINWRSCALTKAFLMHVPWMFQKTKYGLRAIVSVAPTACPCQPVDRFLIEACSCQGQAEARRCFVHRDQAGIRTARMEICLWVAVIVTQHVVMDIDDISENIDRRYAAAVADHDFCTSNQVQLKIPA